MSWGPSYFSNYFYEKTAAYGSENVDVSSMAAWLCGHVGHSISTNDIAAPEVTCEKIQGELRPATDTKWSIGYFKGKVPNYSSVCLLTFIGVLRKSGFVSLNRKNELDDDILTLCSCQSVPLVNSNPQEIPSVSFMVPLSTAPVTIT